MCVYIYIYMYICIHIHYTCAQHISISLSVYIHICIHIQSGSVWYAESWHIVLYHMIVSRNIS